MANSFLSLFARHLYGFWCKSKEIYIFSREEAKRRRRYFKLRFFEASRYKKS